MNNKPFGDIVYIINNKNYTDLICKNIAEKTAIKVFNNLKKNLLNIHIMENIIKKFKILEQVEIYLSYKYSLNELEQLKDLVIENINNLISVEDFTSTKKVGSDFVVNEFFKKPSFEEHIFKVIIFLEEEKFFIRILKFINNERKSRLYLQINDNFIESLDFIKDAILRITIPVAIIKICPSYLLKASFNSSVKFSI